MLDHRVLRLPLLSVWSSVLFAAFFSLGSSLVGPCGLRRHSLSCPNFAFSFWFLRLVCQLPARWFSLRSASVWLAAFWFALRCRSADPAWLGLCVHRPFAAAACTWDRLPVCGATAPHTQPQLSPPRSLLPTHSARSSGPIPGRAIGPHPPALRGTTTRPTQNSKKHTSNNIYIYI